MFRIVPNEMKFCLNVFAPLVHDLVLAKFVSGTMFLELLLPCLDFTLLMKKEQKRPAS